jgi:hypothetical protein
MLGCNAVRYTEPETGNRARVRFAINAGESVTVYGYKTGNCKSEENWMWLRNGPILISPRKRLGIPLWNYHDNAAKEFYISTERPLIVMFKSFIVVGYPGSWSICDVPVIYPLEEKDYEVSFNWGWYGAGCSADVFEIVETNFGLYKKRLLKTFDNKISFDNADCMKAFEKRRRHWSDIMFRIRTYK